MAYVEGNPPTKKALKEMLASGKTPAIFSPGPFAAKRDGEESVEGPQYPKPHSWYARVRVENGLIVKVLS